MRTRFRPTGGAVNQAVPRGARRRVAGPVLAQKEKADPEKFQGTWAIVKAEQEGKPLEEFAEDNTPVTICKDGKYTFKGTGFGDEVGEFELDPKAKIPAVDYKITAGTHKGKTRLGIYTFDGDTLVVCLAEEGADKRPTGFKTAEYSPEYVLFAMKRKK